jgi:hypothetical protein
MLTKISGFSIVTQQTLVGSQIQHRPKNGRLTLPNLLTDNGTSGLELKHLIGAEVVMLKCWVFGGETSPNTTVRVSVWYSQLQRNGLVLVANQNRNRSSRLDPLLTPAVKLV